jgi:hypothetical protein
MLGALSVARTLDSLGASYQVIPDRVRYLTSMRDRNVVLFGDANLESGVAKLLERGVFKFKYDIAAKDFAVVDGKTLSFAPSPDKPGHLRDYYGLLTVMPSDGAPGGAKRTVVLAGANSAGCQGAAEFFSSARNLKDLRERFAKEGIDGFPKAYQVVVKSRTDGMTLLSASYAAHAVLDR